MLLRETVDKYLRLGGGFGKPVSLADFGLSRQEIERIFSILDEDYHISRFFHFSKAAGESFEINGFAHTHVSIDAEIRTIL